MFSNLTSGKSATHFYKGVYTMAKSIFEILDDVTTETSVPSQGKDDNGKALVFAHTLPRDLFPTSEQFESPEDLLEWAEDSGYTHAILQRGVQKFLIETRAAYKSCKKDDTWSESYGQDNVDAVEWTTVKRPNQGSTASLDKARFKDCMDMIVQLTENGMDIETIKTMTTKIYGESIVNAILDAMK